MNVTREIINLHCGQAGIQMGDAIWQTLAAEHNINPSGKSAIDSKMEAIDQNAARTFFHVGPDDQYFPRSLFVDSEPTVLDEIRSGYFRNLFHPDLLVSSIEDAANNFARGYYNISRLMMTDMIEKCRYIAESCENFQGFMNYSGSGGGTGSGLFSRFLQQITVEYSSKMAIGTIIVPGKTLNNCVVDPYNTVFRFSQSTDTEDINFVVDNESLYRICSRVGIVRPNYHDVNKVLTPVLTTLTAPVRFEGPLTGALNEISTNLIPYPRINFPMVSYTPFSSTAASLHTPLNSKDMTVSLFEPGNNLISHNLSNGFFISAVLIYRGCHITNSIIQAVKQLKTYPSYKWVDWCPTGFKISHTTFPALHSFAKQDVQPDKSILMLCNHTGIIRFLDRNISSFLHMFRKRSYLFWYLGEGMEQSEFNIALDDVIRIKGDYVSVSKPFSNTSYISSREEWEEEEEEEEDETLKEQFDFEEPAQEVNTETRTNEQKEFHDIEQPPEPLLNLMKHDSILSSKTPVSPGMSRPFGSLKFDLPTEIDQKEYESFYRSNMEEMTQSIMTAASFNKPTLLGKHKAGTTSSDTHTQSDGHEQDLKI